MVVSSGRFGPGALTSQELGKCVELLYVDFIDTTQVAEFLRNFFLAQQLLNLIEFVRMHQGCLSNLAVNLEGRLY